MRRTLATALLVSGALLMLTSSAVLADNPDAGLTVEPSEVTAGQTILLAGNDLEPDDERVLVLQGENLAVSLGTATTDADGMLSQEIQIPAHLPTGSYELQAIGDETLEVEVKVTAVEGGATEASSDEATIVARDRTPFELIVVLAAAALAVVIGGFLVLRAERFGGAHAAE